MARTIARVCCNVPSRALERIAALDTLSSLLTFLTIK